MNDFTGNRILGTLEDAGFTACWEWTGGNCRAVCVFKDQTMTGPRVRITHGWDPFTDNDLEDDVTGCLAVGFYPLDEHPEEPTVRVIEAISTDDVLAAVTPLLTPHSTREAESVSATARSVR